MPTPNEGDYITQSSSDSTSTFRIACPPEEARSQSHVNTERTQDTSSDSSNALGSTEEFVTRQRRVRAATLAERRRGVSAETTDSEESERSRTAEFAKAEHIEDTNVLPEPSSPVVGPSSEPTSETESRAQCSISTPDVALNAPPPQYICFPEVDHARARSTLSSTSFLRPGSKFRGTQESDKQIYDVQVEIKDVDLSQSFICGYLRIQGLTEDHPTLTTFFEGEIIGDKYTFKTAHPTWNSSEKIDLQHWARFPAWKQLAKSSKLQNFTLRNYLQREHLFMRWKEYFLVPDHRVKTIMGASFEGFYYICFNQCSGNVSGIYFHAKSEKYQQLELKHVDDRGCMAAVDFR